MKHSFAFIVSMALVVLVGCADSGQDTASQLAIQQAQAQADQERNQLAEITDLSGKCQQLDIAACGDLSEKACAIDDQETCSSAQALQACQTLRAAAARNSGRATTGTLSALTDACVASARKACRNNVQDYCTFLCDAKFQDGCAQYVVNAQAEKAEALQRENEQTQAALELQREESQELQLRQAERFQVQQNNSLACQLGNQSACLSNVLGALIGQ
jgi:hypothetical protein